LLADRHHGLSEGIRGLLETEFETVVMVANEISLVESAIRLQPNVVVADLALVQGDHFSWLHQVLARCPQARVIVLSSHDEVSIRDTAFAAGAAGFVCKREIASQLLEATDAVLAGRRFPPAEASSGR
jgi:DNA-binding NarL/FixJ family response regulator